MFLSTGPLKLMSEFSPITSFVRLWLTMLLTHVVAHCHRTPFVMFCTCSGTVSSHIVQESIASYTHMQWQAVTIHHS